MSHYEEQFEDWYDNLNQERIQRKASEVKPRGISLEARIAQMEVKIEDLEKGVAGINEYLSSLGNQ